MRSYLPPLLGLVFLSLLPFHAHAAQIERSAGDKGLDLIIIQGEIVAGDEKKFAGLALQSNEALVLLDSPGGALGPALEIGRTIQIKGFSTYIPAQTECTSACALVWLAGDSRLASTSAKIGFHAGYRNNNGQAEEMGAANAVIGRYLTLLNLPQKAVLFATSAPPQGFLWLTSDNADAAGIPYKIFDLDDDSEQTEVSVAPPPIQVQAQGPEPEGPPPPLVDWYYFAKSDGSIFYARGDDVRDGRTDSRSARLWVKTDDSANRKRDYRSSITLYMIDCTSMRYRILEETDYFANGNHKSYDFRNIPTNLDTVVPDSIFESGVDLVCSDKLPASDPRDILHR
jgi:hypothetical protein